MTAREKLFAEAVLNNTLGEPFELEILLATLGSRHVRILRRRPGEPREIAAEIKSWRIDDGEWVDVDTAWARETLHKMPEATQLEDGRWQLDVLDALL